MADRILPDHPSLGLTAHPYWLTHKEYGLRPTAVRLTVWCVMFGTMLNALGTLVLLVIKDREVMPLLIGHAVMVGLGCYAMCLVVQVSRAAAEDYQWIRQVRDALR